MPDPVYQFTGNVPGGQLAVFIFFVLSGYLITDSWLKNPDPYSFFAKRILRIYPALIAVVILSIFVFGPIITSLPVSEYFQRKETYSYLQNMTLWKLQFNLPGVMIDGREVTFNATLWTLFFEFLMYSILPILALAGIFRSGSGRIYILWAMLILLIFVEMTNIPKTIFVMKISAFNFVRLFIYFYAGSLYRYYFSEKRIHFLMLPVLFIMLTLLRGTHLFYPALLVFVTSLVFWVAFYPKRFFPKVFNGNDYSYGLYLYGYIVQNFIQYYLGNSIPLYPKILLSLMITFIFAFLSWHLIESKCLKLKSRIQHKPSGQLTFGIKN